MMVDLNGKINQTTIAEVVGISRQALSRMLNKIVLDTHTTIGDGIRMVFSQLREQAAGRASGSNHALVKARTESKIQKAESIRLSNFERKEFLLPLNRSNSY